MRIAITGATGFIGQNLVSYLARKGYQVVAIVRDTSKAKDLFKSSVTLRKGDITDNSSLLSSLQNIDITIHLAALFNKPEASWEDFYEHNVNGVLNVLNASKIAGANRFIHCSTGGVVAGNSRLPFDEQSPYAVRASDKYEVTKCEAEKRAIDYSRENNYPITVVRPTQPYGPGDRNKIKLYQMVKRGVIVHPGDTLKHPVYIEDLCRGFELAINTESSANEIITIGNYKPLYLNELISLIAEALKVPYPRIVIPSRLMYLLCLTTEKISNQLKIKPVLHRGNIEFFTKSVVFNVRKADNLLGFRNEVSVKKGVAETVKWLYREGLI